MKKLLLLLFFLTVGMGLVVLSMSYFAKSNVSNKPTFIHVLRNTLLPSKDYLFSYGDKVEKAKLQISEQAAREVTVKADLLLDPSIESFTLNLFDGYTYKVQKSSELMKEYPCTNSDCTWIGHIKDRMCFIKDSVTGICTPGENIIFVVKNGEVTGGIPTVVGINEYTYTLSTRENKTGTFLQKVDPTKVQLFEDSSVVPESQI